MIRRIAAVARKEFIQLYRDWRTLAVTIGLPVVMMMLYGYAINFDIKSLPLGIMDEDRTADSRDLAGAFSRSGYFTPVAYPGEYREATALLDGGKVKAVLVIPRGHAETLAAGGEAVVQLLVDGSDSTTATSGIAYAAAIVAEQSMAVTLETLERKAAIRADKVVPVRMEPRYWFNPELRSAVFIVPGLIAVILMMMSTLVTSMTVVRERERGTMEQLIVTPLAPWELMVGKVAPYVLLSFVDVILVIGVGRVLFDVPLVGSRVLVLVLAAVYLTGALGIGLLISVVAPTQQVAMTIAFLVSMLPSILLSGFIFPIRAMPDAIRWGTFLIPARHFLVIVRGIFLKGVGLEVLWPQVLVLLLFGAVMLSLASAKFRKKL